LSFFLLIFSENEGNENLLRDQLGGYQAIKRFFVGCEKPAKMILAGYTGCVLPEISFKPAELTSGQTMDNTAPCLSKAANLVYNSGRVEKGVEMTAVNTSFVKPARNYSMAAPAN